MTSGFIEEIRTEADSMRLAQAKRRLGLDKHGNPRLTTDSKSEPRLTDPNQSEPVQKRREEKEIPPLPPKGGKYGKTPKVELDILPENETFLRAVYTKWPTEHPLTHEPAKKGAFAPAARNFQRIVDSQEASPRELKSCGMLYAKAESYPPDIQRMVYEAWDHRDHAIMHVSSFYGPEKKPYRQMLPIARIVLERIDAQTAPPILAVPA
ncbi:hypothetical protein METEAL_15360 [Mesoterricola silvestris]|uniref:Uncharacterized protein n=2 Tax=Mesoterricola silvestris TaxID=2927979 RepID=A0AA48GQW3_9BACT|nr:hypothetical protein METEAL_15360 [Mesoterricola silvestris]